MKRERRMGASERKEGKVRFFFGMARKGEGMEESQTEGWRKSQGRGELDRNFGNFKHAILEMKTVIRAWHFRLESNEESMQGCAERGQERKEGMDD